MPGRYKWAWLFRLTSSLTWWWRTDCYFSDRQTNWFPTISVTSAQITSPFIPTFVLIVAKWVYRGIHNNAGLSRRFQFFDSGAQSWAPECPNVKIAHIWQKRRKLSDFKGWVTLSLNFRLKSYVSRQYLWTVRWGNGDTTTLPLKVFTQRNFVAYFIRLKLNF